MPNTTIIVAIVVALLAIVAVTLLMRRPAKPLAPRASEPTSEGQGVVDEAAAAFVDIATPILGTEVHSNLPSDDLTRIKGLGPKAAGLLNGIGIHRYAQLAELDAAQTAEVDRRMGAFQGRITRDQWIEQAGLLARDDIPAFEAKFGKLG
jgi:predicted flap endonuclease-1-like 5' DNA nuclease